MLCFDCSYAHCRAGLENLASLPAFRFADYERLTVWVRSTSKIEVRQVVYSVPPTLIGRQVTVRLHHDRLVVFLGATGSASSRAPMAPLARSEPGASIWST